MTSRPSRLPIQSLVFDLGAVLLNWQPAQIVSGFTNDVQLQQLLLDAVFLSDTWKAMDRGDITEQEARFRFARDSQLSAKQIESLMTLIKESLTPIEPMVEAVLMLKAAGYPVFGLSNICQELFDHVSSRYAFFNAFDDLIVSAAVKLAKPETAIYRLMLERFQVQPHTTLFIDDRQDNIASATRLGIQTLHCDNPTVVANQLKQLLFATQSPNGETP